MPFIIWGKSESVREVTLRKKNTAKDIGWNKEKALFLHSNEVRYGAKHDKLELPYLA